MSPLPFRVVTTAVAAIAALARPTPSQDPPKVPPRVPAATETTLQPASQHLLLGSVYRTAERQNPRADAARALARAASARVPGARRPPDPQLQFGFMNYELPGLRPMDQVGMRQFQAMQMLPVAGKLGLSGDVAASQARALSFRAGEVALEVRTQAAMAFYELYQAEQSLEVARQTKRLLEDIARIAESMYRVGEGQQADVLRARVEIARMTEDIVRMEAMREAQAARLNAILDEPVGGAVPSPALPRFPTEVPSLDTLLASARAGRQMLQAGEQEVVAADKAAQLARREIWPDLQVGFQYGQRPAMEGVGTERMGSLMLGASMPIFARSRQLQMREEAAAMRAMATSELSSMWAETRGRVTEMRAELIRARNLTDLYRTTVLPQAEATVTSTLAAYRVGRVNFMTLLDARMTVNRYRQELYALEADQGKAWAELEMLLGRTLFDADAVAPTVAAGGSK